MMNDIQANEERDFYPQTESQMCYDEANDRRREIHDREARKIANAIARGKWVLVDEQPYHCKATDAVAGMVVYFIGEFHAKSFADHAAEQLCARDPEARPSVRGPAPKVTVAEVRAACREAGVSFRRISETGEFKVGGYFTTDAADAIATAKRMAAERNSNSLPF